MQPEWVESEARNLLEQWIQATLDRDPSAFSNLFSRDPEPLVVWGTGEVTTTWKAVHDHALRELNRGEILIPDVDLYEVHAILLDTDTVHAVFRYDVSTRDLWGTERLLHRVGSATLRNTKDGWRFAAVHFSTPRPGPG